MNTSNNIVPGYNGIMPLDLNLVAPKFWKIATNQHYKDIYEYKKEQSLLPKKLRYENTVARIQKSKQKFDEIVNKRVLKIKQEIDIQDQKRIEHFYNNN